MVPQTLTDNASAATSAITAVVARRSTTGTSESTPEPTSRLPPVISREKPAQHRGRASAHAITRSRYARYGSWPTARPRPDWHKPVGSRQRSRSRNDERSLSQRTVCASTQQWTVNNRARERAPDLGWRPTGPDPVKILQQRGVVRRTDLPTPGTAYGVWTGNPTLSAASA